MSNEEERRRRAYEAGREVGGSLGDALLRLLGIPVPPRKPTAQQCPAQPLAADDIKERLVNAISDALAPLPRGAVRPDELAEAVFGAAMHIATETKATGGAARWAAAALLATSDEDVVSATATLHEVFAAMGEAEASDDGKAAPAPVRARPELTVIKGGKR